MNSDITEIIEELQTRIKLLEKHTLKIISDKDNDTNNLKQKKTENQIYQLNENNNQKINYRRRTFG